MTSNLLSQSNFSRLTIDRRHNDNEIRIYFKIKRKRYCRFGDLICYNKII